jgi:hypothetical protein
MIVFDASSLLEFLLQTPLGTRVETRIFRDGASSIRPTWCTLK